MKRFIAGCLLFFVLPALASADYWTYQCDGNGCRRVLVRTPRSTVIAATAATYRTFDDEPIVPAAPLMSFASLSTPAAPSLSSPPILPDSGDFAAASRIVSVGQPVVTSSTCNCASTGFCSCPPGTCACAACPQGRANLMRDRANGEICDDCWQRIMGPSTQYATGNSYFSVPYPTAIETKLIQTPTGHVHVYADGSTAHSGGHVQRVVARQERWRARKGVQ